MSADSGHRQYPAPPSPWVMMQRWHSLLFAHWPIPVAKLRALVPSTFELDTFDGECWLGIVPFRMSDVRPRFTPSFPWLSAFPELNVRTYVVVDGKPGVYFFSLDAGNPVAVQVARKWFHLPYFDATMSCVEQDDRVHYESRRTHWNAPHGELSGGYHPTGPVEQAVLGSLQDWLTSRYCLYTQDRWGRLYRGDIDHAPWPLQPAEATFELNTMANAAGLQLPEVPPLLAFSRTIEVHIWPLVRCG